jgi:hypothetical protein
MTFFLQAYIQEKKEKEDSSLREATSHWLHGNSIPNIGCHYFGLD